MLIILVIILDTKMIDEKGYLIFMKFCENEKFETISQFIDFNRYNNCYYLVDKKFIINNILNITIKMGK